MCKNLKKTLVTALIIANTSTVMRNKIKDLLIHAAELAAIAFMILVVISAVY
jgi:hypothetical protein